MGGRRVIISSGVRARGGPSYYVAPAVFPLSITGSSGAKYLQTAGGSPFLMLCESMWDLAANRPLSGSNSCETYLDRAVTLGYTAVQIRSLVTRGAFGSGTSTALLDGTTPFTGADFATPRDSYFAQIEAFYGACLARNLLVIDFAAYLGSSADDGWKDEMVARSDSELQSYGSYRAARCAAYPNVILGLGGDDTPTGSALARCQALLTGWLSQLPSRPWTFHTGSQDASSSMDGGLTPDPALNLLYSNNSDLSYDTLISNAISDGRPWFLGENRYYGGGWGGPVLGSRASVRGDAITSMLRGGFGATTGRECLWPAGIANPFGFEPTIDTVAEWATEVASNIDGRADSGRTRNAIASHAWHTCSTLGNGTLVTSGTPTAIRFNGSTLAIAYTLSGASFTIDMSKFSGPITATWYDPTNGSSVAATGSQPFANSGTHAFNAGSERGNNSAGDADWVLFLSVGGA